MELKSKRTEYSTRFINPDGTFTEEIYLEPIFYQEPSEKEWKEINNNLVLALKGLIGLRILQTVLKCLSPNSSGSNEILSIEKDGRQVDFIPVGAKKGNSKATNNEIIYNGIYPDVDIRYELQGSKVKEDIILNSYTEQNVFTFEIKIKGYTVVQESDGIIYFISNKGEKEWHLLKPFMLDAEEKYSDAVEYVLRQENGKSYVDVVADKEFLQDPDTKYPVIIDPTIDNWNVMIDTFVSSYYYNSSYSDLTNMYTGNDAG